MRFPRLEKSETRCWQRTMRSVLDCGPCCFNAFHAFLGTLALQSSHFADSHDACCGRAGGGCVLDKMVAHLVFLVLLTRAKIVRLGERPYQNWRQRNGCSAEAAY